MKFLELYDHYLINEGLETLSYSVPEDKYEQLVDFYVASYPYATIKGNQYLLFSPKGEAVQAALEEAKEKIIEYLYGDVLDAVFYSLANEIMGITYRTTRSLKENEISKNFSKLYSKLNPDIEIDKVLKLIDKTYAGNRLEAVSDFKKVFELEDFWHPNIGGKSWAAIADGWIRLNNAKTLQNKSVEIDHIIDLQHNTGNVFSRVRSYYRHGYEWLKNFLEFKKNVTGPWQLLRDASYDMKQIVRPLIKMSGGGSEDRAPEETEDDKVTKNPASIADIEKPNEELQLKVVNQDGNALQHIKNPSEKVQLAAVQQNGRAIQYIENPSEKVKLEAVKQNGWAISYLEKPSEAVKQAAVQESGRAIKFIKNPSKKLQLIAVNQNGWAIKHIENPSEEVQKAAVRQNGLVIKDIPKPSKDVQLAAVRQNGWAIKSINNPAKEIKAEAVKQNKAVKV